MSNKPFLCNYCKLEQDGSQIYTAKKRCNGVKIVDILQTLSQKSVPETAPIKLCSMCISTLHAATGIVEKTKQLIETLAPTPTPTKKQAAEQKGLNAREGEVSTAMKQVQSTVYTTAQQCHSNCSKSFTRIH